MSSLTIALAILFFELIVVGVLAVLFGERLRERLFRRRRNAKAFAMMMEDKNPDAARGLVVLHETLGRAIAPVNADDPRPKAQQAAQLAVTRAMETLSKAGTCDAAVVLELLAASDRLAEALRQVPVLRETVTVHTRAAEESPAPQRESILKSILMESEQQETSPEPEAETVLMQSDPLDYAMGTGTLSETNPVGDI